MTFTFDKHPKKVGQMEVMQENDDDARSFVGLASVQLPTNESTIRISIAQLFNEKRST